MADDSQVERAKSLIGWPSHYMDTSVVKLALTSGDIDSDDREGNRSLAHYGDIVVAFVIETIGFRTGISREQLHMATSLLKEKKQCARLAVQCGLDKLIKPSNRQKDLDPQPKVLKNALYALVAAVWTQEYDWSQTVTTMVNLGLLPRPNDSVEPHDLEAVISTNDVLAATKPYIWTPEVKEAKARSDSVTSPSQSPVGPAMTSSAAKGANFNDSSCSTVQDKVTTRVHGVDPVVPCVEAHEIAARDQQPQVPDAFDFVNLTSNDSRQIPLWSDSFGDAPQGNAFRKTDPQNVRSRVEKSKYRRVSDIGVMHPAQAKLRDIIIRFERSASPGLEVGLYCKAICDIGSENPDFLLNIIAGMGSSSTLLSLRTVLEELRIFWANPSVASVVAIAESHSEGERLDAITALRAIHHRGVQVAWQLHIYVLYNDTSRKRPQLAATTDDPFVLVSGGLPQAKQPRGNPHNRETAALTREIMDILPSNDSTTRHKEAEKLRRVGKRLKTLVDRFGLGVLALVDTDSISDIPKLLKVSEVKFAQFIDVVDTFEGENIRRFSEAVEPIVQMVLGRISSYPVLVIETVDNASIQAESRCSPRLREMFREATTSADHLQQRPHTPQFDSLTRTERTTNDDVILGINAP